MFPVKQNTALNFIAWGRLFWREKNMEIEEATAAVEDHHEMQSFSGMDPQDFSHGSFLSNVSNVSCRISYADSAKMWLFVLIALTCVPLIAGAAFTSIFIEDNNINGAVSAFFAAAISLGTMSLFVLHLFGKIETYHDHKTLNGLKVLGMLVSVASGILLGVYAILAFLNKQSFALFGLNYFSSAVFSGICLASSLQLYITAQWYRNAMQARGSYSSSGHNPSSIFP